MGSMVSKQMERVVSKRVSNRKGSPSKNKSRRRHSRAVEIPGRRENLNAAMAIMLGAAARMFGARSKRASSSDTAAKE